MDSPSLLDLFFLPEYLREAFAGALTRSELMPYGVADVVATIVFTLIMAAIYFGIVGAIAWGFLRRARADEEVERAAGAHRAMSPDAPWHKLAPNGFEADLCAWVVNDQSVARVFVATVLRLLRAGVMEITHRLKTALWSSCYAATPTAPTSWGARRRISFFPRDLDVFICAR